MGYVIRNDQKLTLTVGFEDDHRNTVTTLGSIPVWEVSDTSLGVITVDESSAGMSATFYPTGQAGSVIISAYVDADPGEEVVHLMAHAEIAILPGQASVARLTGVIDKITPEECHESEKSNEEDDSQASIAWKRQMDNLLHKPL